MSDIPSWARVGAKVVCVKVGKWEVVSPGVGKDGGPCFGEICTIEAVWMGGAAFIDLVEYPGHKGFWIARFRPLVDDEIEATLYRTKRIPSRAKRKTADA